MAGKLEQQLAQIKEDDESKTFEPELWLRPEYRNIMYDINKLKWMDTPENIREEDLAIAEMIDIDERADPETHGELIVDEQNTIASDNKKEMEFRYRNADITKDTYGIPGTKKEITLKSIPPKPRNPLKNMIVADQPMMPHVMYSGMMVDRFEFSDDISQFQPRDDMQSVFIADEVLLTGIGLQRKPLVW